MKTIYGRKPFFPDSTPREVDDETADKLVESGKATYERETMPWRNQSVTTPKEDKIEPAAKRRNKK